MRIRLFINDAERPLLDPAIALQRFQRAGRENSDIRSPRKDIRHHVRELINHEVLLSEEVPPVESRFRDLSHRDLPAAEVVLLTRDDGFPFKVSESLQILAVTSHHKHRADTPSGVCDTCLTAGRDVPGADRPFKCAVDTGRRHKEINTARLHGILRVGGRDHVELKPVARKLRLDHGKCRIHRFVHETRAERVENTDFHDRSAVRNRKVLKSRGSRRHQKSRGQKKTQKSDSVSF